MWRALASAFPLRPRLEGELAGRAKDKSSLPKTIDGVKVIYDYVGKITPR